MNMEIIPVVVMLLVSVLVFVNAQQKASRKKDQQAQAAQQREKVIAWHEQQTQAKPVKPYVPAPAPVTEVAGQQYIPTLPDKKPPQGGRAQARVKPGYAAEGAGSHEGVEFHEKGFHGQMTALEQAAQQAAWERAPEKQAAPKVEERPMFSAQELRNAFIMQEILDEPVSRRRRSGYGR